MPVLAALALDLLLACLLDRLIGDPPGWPHPVNLIGRFIRWFERRFHPGAAASACRARAAGLALAAATVGLAGLAAGGLLAAAAWIHPLAFHALLVVTLAAGLAGRCLENEARGVWRALADGGAGLAGTGGPSLAAARAALSRLVTRDTSSLDEAAIVRATVETVAENTVDGSLSPLFWIAAGLGVAGAAGAAALGTALPDDAVELPAWLAAGYLAPLPVLAVAPAVLLWMFKAASTLDSLVGYKTERHLWFGRASAKLDDAANWLPARLSIPLLAGAAAACRLDVRAAWRVAWRDRRKHASPNSAHPEAAVAGALGIRLGGPAVYHGHLEDKPALGDDRRPPEPEDIGRACALLRWSTGVLVTVIVLGAAAVAGGLR